jgi:hypothetical protein
MRFGYQPVAQGTRDPRLANAGLAGHEDNLALTPLGLLPTS